MLTDFPNKAPPWHPDHPSVSFQIMEGQSSRCITLDFIGFASSLCERRKTKELPFEGREPSSLRIGTKQIKKVKAKWHAWERLLTTGRSGKGLEQKELEIKTGHIRTHEKKKRQPCTKMGQMAEDLATYGGPRPSSGRKKQCLREARKGSGDCAPHQRKRPREKARVTSPKPMRPRDKP